MGGTNKSYWREDTAKSPTESIFTYYDGTTARYGQWDLYHYKPGDYPVVDQTTGICTSRANHDSEYSAQGPERVDESYTVKTKAGWYTAAASFSNTVLAASGGQTALITVSAQSVGVAGNSITATGNGTSTIATLFTSDPVDIPIGSNQVPALNVDITLTGGHDNVEYKQWNSTAGAQINRPDGNSDWP